ncbi:MAG TPA: hypothetical protein VGK73_02400 [Polyangiaceae bacterium]
MIIKRGAFLLLTSALAHQACVVNDDDDGGEGGEAGETSGGSSSGGKSGGKSGSAGTGTSGSSGSSGSGSGGEAGAAQAGQPGTGGDDGASGEGGSPSEAGSGGSAGEPQGGQGGQPQGAGGEGGEPSCDDSSGTPGDCTAFDETDCSFERSYCTSAGTFLKPRVAEAATECMLADADCSTSGIDPYACVRTALEGACPDAANDAFCAYAVTLCDPQESLDAAGCHALVDGLNEDGLASVTSCVEDGCTFGLWSCVESL